ncbi:class I SAM-dependent methyltransferase [Candidatus Woesearchaeota archaeon]|nr:class I SAM-dependent methyltransferase [Candidatus Woesearchaeota archaeon]
MYKELRERFREGLRAGTYRFWSQEEIADVVEREMFFFEPLQELEEEDRTIIFGEICKHVSSESFNSPHYAELASEGVYVFGAHETTLRECGLDPPKLGNRYEILVPAGREYFLREDYYLQSRRGYQQLEEALQQCGRRPLSVEEKEKLFFDPKFMDSARLVGTWGSTGTHGFGMRTLKEYGFTDEQFLEMVGRIQRSMGKKIINVLDVGGANGVALRDMRTLSDAIVTHNLTPTVEPAMYPVDFLHTCTAERMPASLRESMDLVFSNYAFCYFPGQNLALENILQVLSVGGEADLNLNWGKQDVFVPNFSQRMADQYRRLKKLHDQRYIELEVKGNERFPHPLSFPVDKGGRFYPPAHLKMRKLKSLN